MSSMNTVSTADGLHSDLTMKSVSSRAAKQGDNKLI